MRLNQVAAMRRAYRPTVSVRVVRPRNLEPVAASTVLVWGRIVEAARIVESKPNRERALQNGGGTAWPEFVRRLADAYGWEGGSTNATGAAPRRVATAQDGRRRAKFSSRPTRSAKGSPKVTASARVG